jgi:hypothetical protein
VIPITGLSQISTYNSKGWFKKRVGGIDMAHARKSSAVMELYLKAQGVLNYLATYENEDLIRVKRIIREELPLALKAFRADLGIYPLPNDEGFCNLAALNNKLMVPSFLQHKWRGPYINLKIHS